MKITKTIVEEDEVSAKDVLELVADHLCVEEKYLSFGYKYPCIGSTAFREVSKVIYKKVTDV